MAPMTHCSTKISERLSRAFSAAYAIDSHIVALSTLSGARSTHERRIRSSSNSSSGSSVVSASATSRWREPGRSRDRRDHRPDVGIFRLLRLCDRLGPRLPQVGFPLCVAAERHAVIRSRFSPSASWRGRSATSIFLAVERVWGRSVKLTVALFLLGASTVSLGFLPGYAQVGWASALILSILRIGQGLAFGGVWDGLPSLLAIYSPEKQRGWYAMIPQLGAPLGLIVASGLFAYFITLSVAAGFLTIGAGAIRSSSPSPLMSWRLFSRLRIVTSPEYQRAVRGARIASRAGEGNNRGGRP